jgi:hypothetical protein
MLLDLVLFILLVEMLFISFVELLLQWNLWKPTLKHYITTGDKNIFLVYNYSIWSMIQRGSDKSFTNLWSLLLYIQSLLHYIENAQEHLAHALHKFIEYILGKFRKFCNTTGSLGATVSFNLQALSKESNILKTRHSIAPLPQSRLCIWFVPHNQWPLLPKGSFLIAKKTRAMQSVAYPLA